MHARLADAGLAPTGVFAVPSSVEAIAPLVGQILVETESRREVTELYLFYNRPTSGAAYAPVRQRLLPLDEDWHRTLAAEPWPTKSLPEVIGGGTATLRALVREYLFVSLFRACAESLASENASRLAAMERADKNIGDRSRLSTGRSIACARAGSTRSSSTSSRASKRCQRKEHNGQRTSECGDTPEECTNARRLPDLRDHDAPFRRSRRAESRIDAPGCTLYPSSCYVSSARHAPSPGLPRLRPPRLRRQEPRRPGSEGGQDVPDHDVQMRQARPRPLLQRRRDVLDGVR